MGRHPSEVEVEAGAAPVVAGVGAAPARHDQPDLVPARMVNEFAYCPRLFFLEWVHAQFADNTDTVEGRWVHRAVDEPGGAVPEPGEGEVTVARSVMLSSPALGLVAKVDLLEGAPDGTVVPVDTKRGSPPDIPALRS